MLKDHPFSWINHNSCSTNDEGQLVCGSNYRIYVGKTKKCIICGKVPKTKAKKLSSNTIIKYFQQYKILLKPSLKICGYCRNKPNKILPSNKLEKYQPNQNNTHHKVGESYLKILHQKINKLSKAAYAPTTTLKKKNKTLQNKVVKLQKKIDQVQDNNHYSNHKNIQ